MILLDFAYWLFSYIVPFLVVLTIIVFVHEMGHYWVARWNGVAIKAFSIGFGPELFGWNDQHGTRWKLCAIPLGGYVQFVGDMNPASQPAQNAQDALPPDERDRLFINKNVWQRITVVIAGPAANVIFTFLVLYALLLSYGQFMVTPTIDEVAPQSVAEAAGIEAGDLIVSVDGYSVRGFNDFQRLVETSPQREVVLVIDRNGLEKTISLVPDVAEITDRFGNVHRVGRIGVGKTITEEDVFRYQPGMIEAVSETFFEMIFILDRSAAFIGDFFVGRGDVEQLGGPVKVAKISGEVATLGVIALINLTALLSLNIGIFNLLPIPLLDGGHLVFYLYEAIVGKPLPVKAQEFGFRIGIMLIGSLMIFTLINDLFI